MSAGAIDPQHPSPGVGDGVVGVESDGGDAALLAQAVILGHVAEDQHQSLQGTLLAQDRRGAVGDPPCLTIPPPQDAVVTQVESLAGFSQVSHQPAYHFTLFAFENEDGFERTAVRLLCRPAG